MILRLVLIVLLAVASASAMAQAQSGKTSASAAVEPEMLEITALLSAPNGGFLASREVLENSFALRRHWDGVQTPLDLSNQYA